MRVVALSCVVIALPFGARAQWMTQRFNLVQGWNAIHLKMNPPDTLCETVFDDAAITKVSWWNRDRLDDGTGSAITDFCNWYRSGGEPSTFQRVIGDKRYLVYCESATTLDVVGTPAIPSGTIYLGEYNLVGVNVPNNAGASAPTYYEYFMPFYYRTPSWYGVPAEDSSAKVRFSNSALASDASTAVWLEALGTGTATFTGPFLLALGNSDQTLAWTDDASVVRTITIKNTSSEDRVLRIERNSSLPPPAGHGTCTGDIALLRETIDWSGGYANAVYVPFLNDTTTYFTTNLASGATFELRLKPDTSKMSASSGDYMSILVISDKGSVISGESRPAGTCLYRVGAFASGSLMESSLSSAAGLWVGTVVLAQVNRAKTLSSAEPEWGSDNLFTAPHPFQFRLFVHVDGSRNVKILKEVYTAKATSESDTMLLTDRATAVAFRGEYPNGTIKRSSSANFPFMAPLALSGGEFMVADSVLSATYTQQYDDKTNPFVHSFHPQHDNLAFNNQKPSKLDSGDAGSGEYESWSVTREISLKFLSDDPSGAAGEEWNRTVTGGVYDETVSGLTGQGKPIKTRGIFRLTKVNDVSSIHSNGVLD